MRGCCWRRERELQGSVARCFRRLISSRSHNCRYVQPGNLATPAPPPASHRPALLNLAPLVTFQ